MTTIKSTGLLLASLLIATMTLSGVVWAREEESAVQTLSSQEESPLAIALAYLEDNKGELGLTDADLDGLLVQWQYTSQHNGVTHIFLRQTHAGIEVWNGNIQINVAPGGRIINLHNQFVSSLAGKVNTVTPQLTAVEAVAAAAGHLNLTTTEPLEVQESTGGPEQAMMISAGGISYQPIPIKLMYQPGEKGQVRLAWNMEIEEMGSIHWWTMHIDAETGAVLSRYDRVAQDSYRVYPPPVESPYFSVPPAPADGRTLVLNPATANGSPFGWHDTNGIVGADFTTTQGNNAHAYTDTDANNVPDPGSSPNGGPTLVFDFPIDLTQQPSAYRPAAVSNLFYWSNVIHDVFYEYGFTEPAGNFQENNYGNGGLGSDYVQAEAQDGSGTCNANFGTPGDGGNPRMQMYICENGGGAPAHDGDLDNLVITHEYGHGISNRLADPTTASCLFNNEQMGEGWSDYWGIWMTTEPGDTGPDPRAVGTYLFEQGPGGVGIRPARYSTNFAINNFTYGDLPPLAIPHGVGFLWATMLWDMNWALIDEYGYNPNIYDTWNTGGNNLANQLVIDGLTLQPCSPGFVDGRDAILAADVALTGGVNQCTIWQAFANRGLGFSASQGSSSSTSDGTEAFDLPTACLTLNIPVTSIDICQGDTAVYNIGVGVAFTPPVSMSATGNPAPSTAVFTPNPIPATPGATNLTIGNTGTIAAGNYTINVVADDGSVSDNADVNLNVFAATPGAPTLLAPANGATNTSTLPTLSWNAITNAISYEVEIATDVGFTNIVYSAVEPTTSHAVGTALNPTTLYFWRVRAQNPCGFGTFASPFSFITGNLSVLLVDDDDNSPNVQATYTSALNNLGVTYDIWNTNNSDNEPMAAQLAAYHTVIWFTGDEFGGFAGPGATGEAALGSWLDSGKCLFLSSQDYLWDRGGGGADIPTPFMTNYLGLATGNSDVGQSNVTGAGSVFSGLGPYPLVYPFTNFSDDLAPNGTAELAFSGNAGVGNAAINKDSGVYRTTWWGFPWEAINSATNREEAMQVVIDWCAPPTSGTAVWDGGGGTNNWSEAANWVGDVVPQASDTVLFDTTSTKDALLDITFPGTVANMVINTGYTGTITMARPFAVTGNYTQVDGVFVVSDPVTAVMTVGGSMTHTGGVLRQTRTVNDDLIPFLQIENGAAAIQYRGMTLDANASNSNLGPVTVNVRAVDRVTQFCTGTGSLSGPYAGRCFDITPTITGTALVRLYALTSELPGGAFSPAVYHDTTGGGNWVQLTIGAATGTVGTYTFAEAEATGFSPFLIGDIIETPTAVTLTSLSASADNLAGLVAMTMVLLLFFTGLLVAAQRKKA